MYRAKLIPTSTTMPPIAKLLGVNGFLWLNPKNEFTFVMWNTVPIINAGNQFSGSRKARAAPHRGRIPQKRLPSDNSIGPIQSSYLFRILK